MTDVPDTPRPGAELPVASGRAPGGLLAGGRLQALSRAWLANDGAIYAAFSLCCATYAAAVFYGYLLVQTGGVWSAPLDDVFIHFDYARSFARGYPFHWSEGNGYSSGNTSLSYPIVLALGYALGFRDLGLVVWASIVATVAVTAFLYNAGRLVDGVASVLDPEGGRSTAWMKYLVPPAVLSMGALDWTLFSGMENAWHLGCWGICLAALERLNRADSPARRRRRAWLLGAAGALLLSARPESVVCVATFGLFGVWQARREGAVRRWRDALGMLLPAAIPGVVFLVLHALANRYFTGEWTANGAIAKVLTNNPYMTAAEKWRLYLDLLEYIVPRLVGHHFADEPPWGGLVVGLAALPLFVPRFRPVAVLLWLQIVGWLLLVSINTQIRWHNERYAMPAVAWLMVLAAIGLGSVAGWVPSAKGKLASVAGRWRSLWPLRVGIAATLAALYWLHQSPRMKDQVWFFARAGRNILDQHVTAGLVLQKLGVGRVLVGDAGALIYAGDVPGLDLIGLGGYHDYPFARSTVHGVGASLELIERIPPHERPDIMAIYPSWWGDIPVQFGTRLTSIPVHGNVICGGPEKVLYRADWSALDRQGAPRTLYEGERVVDELDFADLLSEREHRHNLPLPGVGYVKYRLLGEPDRPERDLFDAGRIVPGGQVARARVTVSERGGRLIVRLAPEDEERIAVTLGGRELGVIVAERGDGRWVEASLPIPAGGPTDAEIELRPESDAVLYHLWLVE